MPQADGTRVTIRPTPTWFEATTRLATRVFNGEVVFFVGSGFSIDSEKNSADRLVGRLLAALLAMDTVLAEEAEQIAPRDTDARRVEERPTISGLRQVFGVDAGVRGSDIRRQPARWMTVAN